jgi:hypothetical protein
VQLLIVLWLLQIILGSFALLKCNINHKLKAFGIIFIFALGYYTLTISGSFLGTPNFYDNEIQGTLNGFDVFTHDGKKEFAVLITTNNGPLLVTLPYTPKAESELDSDMNDKFTKGIPTLLRKRSEQQVDANSKNGGTPGGGQDGAKFDNGKFETFKFIDQLLTSKNPTAK